jgi:peptidyl-prolyl cis-trans isomerase C
MTVRVNDVEIADAAIEEEAAAHEDAPDPRHAARCALAIRELLVQRARAVGLEALPGEEGREAMIEALIEREVAMPAPGEEECRRYYDRHGAQFVSGTLIEASHILFAVTPSAPLSAIRVQAESTLRQLLEDPAGFADAAGKLSNCPSAAQGGNLGQLGRGDTVPEFEAAVFEGERTGVLPQLVKSRYGFHIVRIDRRLPGRQVPFELARERIAGYLAERVERQALSQYIRILAGQADISGVDLGAAESPLVR